MKKITFNAPLNHKAYSYEPMQIEVEKVITLYGKRFEQMRDQSLEDATEIIENRDLLYCEENNAHCVLFLDGKGSDGILVEAEGADYLNGKELVQQIYDEARITASDKEKEAFFFDFCEGGDNYDTYVVSDLNDLINNTDFDALRDQNEETLRQILASLQTAMDSFYSATSHLSAAMGHLYDALGTLRTINGQAEKIFAQLDITLSAVQRAADAMFRAMSKATQWVRDLSGEDVGSFSPLGPEFSESSDALNTSLSSISNELSALNSEISSSSTVLLSDVRAINNQFIKVMNLFLNVLNNTQNVDYTDIFEDVSEESLQSATCGKVLECTNRGSVTADRNAGGIAGAMAIEYDTDPEDDLLSSQNRSMRFAYQTKAILLDCSNYGSVQAKKSCAGCITGRMDLGTISGCGGWGSVDSESGDYVGGVVGLSLASVRSSYAKCTLSGGKYVGGIVGSGSRVSDCISMVVITDCTQLGGAVAGEITGEYSNNRFVSDMLAGVDRVSYSGKAEQIGYDALCAIENIPENFLHLTLRFVAEDTVLREQELFTEHPLQKKSTRRFRPKTTATANGIPPISPRISSVTAMQRCWLRGGSARATVCALKKAHCLCLGTKNG